MAEVLAVDVDDGTFARVKVPIPITVELLDFKVRELQVRSQHHELSAGDVFNSACRSGEV